MPIPGAYRVTFSGPQESADDLIAALTAAGLAAEPCAPMYPEEAGLGWVCVLAHEGEDAPPTGEFQQGVNAKADPIARSFGYAHRSNAVVIDRVLVVREVTRQPDASHRDQDAGQHAT
jgi:hypothetical protein